MERFAWLEGTWTGEPENGVTTTEQWSIAEDRLTGLALRSDDPEPQERLEILAIDGVVVYRAHPRGQPSHDFPLTGSDASSATFADPAHDFPQHLTYRRTGETLEINAEGVVDGEAVHARWELRRR